MTKLLLVLLFSTTVLSFSRAQSKKVSLFAEVIPAVNINSFDVSGDPHLLKAKGLVSLGAGVGVALRPKPKFGLGVLFGYWNTPQHLEVTYREINSGLEKTTSLKHNDAYLFLKLSPFKEYKMKNEAVLALGPVFYFNFYLGHFSNDEYKLYYSSYENPVNNQEQTELNASLYYSFGSDFMARYNMLPIVMTTGGLSAKYAFKSKVLKRKLTLGAEATMRLASTSSFSTISSGAIAYEYDRIGEMRVVTRKSVYADHHACINFVLGIPF